MQPNGLQEGQLTSEASRSSIETGIANTDGIKPGMLLVRLSTGKYELPSDDTDVNVYPVLNHKNQATWSALGTADFTYSQDKPLPLLLDGQIALKSLSVAVRGDKVYCRFQNGNIGYIQNTAHADCFLVPWLEYDGDCGAGDIVPVTKFNLPRS